MQCTQRAAQASAAPEILQPWRGLRYAAESAYAGAAARGGLMTDQARLDQLTVNTIRTLSMDAVQAANSGHPGTPMALAPVAYCLWQRFLRFDPADPRPLRALLRPRLHAHLLAAAPGLREGREPRVRAAGRAVGQARRHQALSPARQQVRGASGVSLDLRHRDDDRSPRRRRGDERG